MLEPPEIVNTIHRMRWQHKQFGGDPKTVTMGLQTYYTLLMDNHLYYTKGCNCNMICGMEIEVRNDLADDVIFIVS